MKKILIVDDSSTARMFVRRCLEIAGFKNAVFFEAADGAEALSKMKEEKLDIIFSDLTMPQMDGFELLKAVKADPFLHNVAVFIISSAGNPATGKKLMEEGATAVLKKPVSPSLLLPIVKSFAENKSTGGA